MTTHTPDWQKYQSAIDSAPAMLETIEELCEALAGLLDMVIDNRLHGDEVYKASAALDRANEFRS